MADHVIQLKPAADEANDGALPPPRLPKSLLDLYRENAKALGRHLRRKYGAGPPDPEDVTQEAFVKLAAITPEQFAGIEHPKAFLFRVAENLLISAKRRSYVSAAHAAEITAVNFDAAGFECTPERVLLAKDQLDLVEATIRAMPENRRRCFLLHRFEGLSFAEIGRRLGISAVGARGHVERAMQDVQETLPPDSGMRS